MEEYRSNYKYWQIENAIGQANGNRNYVVHKAFPFGTATVGLRYFYSTDPIIKITNPDADIDFIVNNLIVSNLTCTLVPSIASSESYNSEYTYFKLKTYDNNGTGKEINIPPCYITKDVDGKIHIYKCEHLYSNSTSPMYIIENSKVLFRPDYNRKVVSNAISYLKNLKFPVFFVGTDANGDTLREEDYIIAKGNKFDFEISENDKRILNSLPKYWTRDSDGIPYGRYKLALMRKVNNKYKPLKFHSVIHITNGIANDGNNSRWKLLKSYFQENLVYLRIKSKGKKNTGENANRDIRRCKYRYILLNNISLVVPYHKIRHSVDIASEAVSVTFK